MAAKKGDMVQIEYEGKLEDGTIFDSSVNHGAPLEFEVGSGQLIPGFENAVMGMNVGEEKTITLQPVEAYGERNPQLVKEVPRQALPPGDIKAGMMLGVKMPNGTQLPARITNVTDSMVTIDINPPLAGKVLIFKIKVVGIVG